MAAFLACVTRLGARLEYADVAWNIIASRFQFGIRHSRTPSSRRNLTGSPTPISLLMVFLTVFLDVVHKDATTSIKKSLPPKEQEKARKAYLNELVLLLCFKCLPLMFSFILLFYLLLPAAAKIIKESSFEIWQFDLGLTLFVFIEAAILVFAILSTSLTIKVLRRYRNTS